MACRGAKKGQEEGAGDRKTKNIFYLAFDTGAFNLEVQRVSTINDDRGLIRWTRGAYAEPRAV